MMRIKALLVDRAIVVGFVYFASSVLLLRACTWRCSFCS